MTRPELFLCSHMINPRFPADALTETQPGTSSKSLKEISSSDLQQAHTVCTHAYSQPLLAMHSEHSCNLSADFPVWAKTLQSPLSTTVTKKKSNVWDINWVRCSTDSGSSEVRTKPTVLSSTLYQWQAFGRPRACPRTESPPQRKSFHSGREIKLNIAVINVWKAEGDRCCSWSLGSKEWTRFKTSLTASFTSLPSMHRHNLCSITRCPCGRLSRYM